MNKLALAALLMFAVQPAFAGRTLDFDQLRDACQNPAKYHSQVQPTGIKVDCADRQTTWVPSQDDSGSLSCHRLVGYSISSDKYTVPMNRAALDLPAVGTNCPVFKQIEETVTISQSLTCEQLLEFKGTATDLCQQMIDQARLDNPSSIVRRETGREHHLCAQQQKSVAGDRGQRGQRGQRDQRKGDKPATGDQQQGDQEQPSDEAHRFYSSAK